MNLINRLTAAIFFAKRFFTMFPNRNSRRITVKGSNAELFEGCQKPNCT